MQNCLATSPAATTSWRSDFTVCSAPPSRRSGLGATRRRCQRRGFVVGFMQQGQNQPSLSREGLSEASWRSPVRRIRSPDGHSTPFASILLPMAAACAILFGSPASVEAGIFSGLESFQIPSLPTPESLKKIQEANVEKYKAFDSNFKKSPFLQDLLKKSKENKEQHKKEIEDKYCERGAEWGIGDCSLVGLPQADKDAFFEKLKQGKTGK